jgi:ubiquinone/menaquinone biosynthesis C-methylase UbiE
MPGHLPKPDNSGLLEATGERLLTENFDDNTIEHLHRYALALSLCEDKDVLDLASGEGYGSNLIAGVARSVVGMDISSEAVSLATAKYQCPSLRFIEGSAGDIPLESASVDVTVSFETIEHLEDHAEMMAELKRVLRPAGLLIISTPDKLNYSELRNYRNPFHVRELYTSEFRELVSRYFRNIQLLKQRLAYGSLITPEEHPSGFAEFSGNHSRVQISNELVQPMYNVCLASDAALPSLPVSFYDGSQAANVLRNSFELQREMDRKTFMSSHSYRLGRALTWPLRKLFRR